MPVLEKAHETQKPLLIVCADIDPEVTQALVLNKLKGTLNVCVVKAPLYGDVQAEVLKDIASVTGTTAINAGNYDEAKLVGKQRNPQAKIPTPRKNLTACYHEKV